ncbi:hypothetical protein ACWKW6_09180 [Dyadobacter jiangsuensis]
MGTSIKLLGLVLVLSGIFVLIFDRSAGAELPLLAGLFIAFVTREKTEDERSLYLKSSSAYIALILGYGIKLISANLYEHQIIGIKLYEINHFLVLVLGMAIILFYLRLYLSAR